MNQVPIVQVNSNKDNCLECTIKFVQPVTLDDSTEYNKFKPIKLEEEVKLEDIPHNYESTTEFCNYEKLSSDVYNDASFLKILNLELQSSLNPFIKSSNESLFLPSIFKRLYNDCDQIDSPICTSFEPHNPIEKLLAPLLNIVSKISKLALDSRHLLKDPSKTRDVSFSTIITKANMLDCEISNIKPIFNDSTVDPRRISPNQLESCLILFQLFQYTAELFLQSSVLKYNPTSLKTQLLALKSLHSLDILLKPIDSIGHISINKYLCFPLFIIGISCSDSSKRNIVKNYFNDMIYMNIINYNNNKQLYNIKHSDLIKQFTSAKNLLEKNWLMNPLGNDWIDWLEQFKDSGI